MPIHVACSIEVFDQERFHQVDKCVTGLAFEIHNQFGRYLDEKLYQRELTRQCRATGLAVEPELRITASLDDFSKDYFADHLVNSGVIVETKAVSTLAPEHIGQTLNYLFLCGLHHATLLNFRPDRVQHKFVSTKLTPADRRRYDMVAADWHAVSPQCDRLHALLVRMLAEWGTHLDPLLYRDALTHFLGGEAQVLREVSVGSEGASLGGQKMHLLADDIAFSVTASTHQPESVFEHQQRFIRHTRLRAIQWVNLNHSRVELRTIER